MDRVRRLKLFLWFITGIGAAIGITRFIFGLGATTNLTDGVAWGFWIGFDVMSGVALAAGGFVVCAIVYIFGNEKYHEITRPAVLTAFLGYIAVVFGLLFDLGLPWNIWHMIIYWNPHSPLFEVGWCVMLYSGVLALEFSPVPLEASSRYAKIRAFLIKLRIPLVIAGIALSTLHQSSLGSLFLIMPHRVAPLWYSPILPILFFISAVLLGLYMVIFESHFTSYFYRRKPETELLSGFGKASRWLALLYLTVRLIDLFVRGQAGYLTADEFLTAWFWIEILLIVVIPFILFSLPASGRIRSVQWTAAFIGVFGVVFNRINVGGVAHSTTGMISYRPAWTEIFISAAVVSFIALVFLFIIEKFRVWEKRPEDPFDAPEVLPEFDKPSQVSLGTPAVFGRRANSFAFILAVAIGFALLSNQKIYSSGQESVPVNPARGGEVLTIDGNLDGYGVSFPHTDHISRIGKEPANCAYCHHMNMPGDLQSECSDCHTQMYKSVDAFKHDWHSSPSGGNISCLTCHEKDVPKSVSSAATCEKCHSDLYPDGAVILVDDYLAPGYVDAMHTACIECHTASNVDTLAADRLDNCTRCHDGTPVTKVTLDSIGYEKFYTSGKFQITPGNDSEKGE